VHDVAVMGLDEANKHAEQFQNTMNRAVQDGIEAFNDIDVSEVLDQIDSILQTLCLGGVQGPPPCHTDVGVEGCMPSDNHCIISYGKECLKISEDVGGSVAGELTFSESKDNVEIQAALSVEASASASINSQVILELHIQSEPKIYVRLDPPTLNLNADITLKADASLTAEVQDQRFNIGPSVLIKKRVFMAGFIPVMIAVRAQPVVFLSASGELHGSGSITFTTKGSISFTDAMWLSLNLANFHAEQNFDKIEPQIQFDEDRWDFEFDADVNVQLTAKVGVEFSVALYDTVEINFLPLVVAQASASGHFSVSGSGDTNGIDGLSAQASGEAEICLSGDFKGYLDWFDGNSNRRSGRGLRRRELMELRREQRRELAETLDFRGIIVDTCGDVIEVIAPGCPPAQEILQAFCGLAMDGLEALGFPLQINVPGIDDLRLPTVDIPAQCFTMALDVSGSFSFDEAKQEGIECGGHFHGLTETNNPSWHTFVAGDEHMIIDGCRSSFKTYIKLYRRERSIETHCVDVPFVASDVCFDWPEYRWTEIDLSEHPHDNCIRGPPGYYSFAEMENLVKGETYAIAVDGWESPWILDAYVGPYSISLSCPSLQQTADGCCESFQDSEGNCMDSCPGQCNLAITEAGCKVCNCPACEDCCEDYPNWDAGYGTCDTYAIDGLNHRFCDVDATASGAFAFKVCAECGYCVKPTEDGGSADAPESDCVNINLRFARWGSRRSWSIHETGGAAKCFGSGYENWQSVPKVNDCCLTDGQRVTLSCYSGLSNDGWDGSYIEINNIRYCEYTEFNFSFQQKPPGYGFVKTYDFIVGQEEPREVAPPNFNPFAMSGWSG